MSKAEELADRITSPTSGPWDNFDAAAELRRLAAIEKSITDAEPVAWMNPEDGLDATTSFRWIRIGDFTCPIYKLNGIKQ